MKLYIANPLYDAVFRYLMEDERIARTILSALLRKEVTQVVQRPHEHVNSLRNEVSMFRVHFSATLREEDGDEHPVLIELQKTWLETETLNCRQYLGAQYLRSEDRKYALHVVTVYLLCHRVDDIQTPVIYVNHKVCDYDGNEIVSLRHNTFAENLTHDSIIVQIPLLHGRVNNRLEKMLSLFDQSNATKANPQTLEINEEEYAGDLEVERIVWRLVSAATNPTIRQEMNAEEYFIKPLQNRDTAIMLRDQRIKELDRQMEEREQRMEAQRNANAHLQADRLRPELQEILALSAPMKGKMPKWDLNGDSAREEALQGI